MSNQQQNGATLAHVPFVASHSKPCKSAANIAASDAKRQQPSDGSDNGKSNRISGKTRVGQFRPKSDGFTRICDHCQQPYMAYHPKSKYCHARCRVAAYRARQGGAK